METTDTLDVIDYNLWPLTCVHCGSDDIIFSPTKDNTLCQCCGEWQLEEEE